MILAATAPTLAANGHTVARDWVDCRKTFYVDADFQGDPKGTAEAPYRSITTALEAIDTHAKANPDFLKIGEVKKDGRQSAPPHPAYGIEVADGTYTHETEAFGKEGLVIAHNVLIRGGHPGNGEWLPAFTPLTKHSRPNATEAIYETTGRGSIIDLQSKSRAFLVQGDAMFRLYGFTVRNGKSAEKGGAVCYQNTRKDPEQDLQRSLIRDCTFEHNEAVDGGAVYANPVANLRIVRNTFRYNKATGKGGAIFSETQSLTRKGVFHAEMYGNEAPQGSAIYGIAGIQHSVIYGNQGGFAVELFRGSANICTIAHNDGGGVRLIPAAEGNHGRIGLTCSIVAYNKGTGLSAPEGAGGIGYRWCDLYGNSEGDRESVPYQHLNYSRPPKFVDGENPDLARRDYSLQADSPCIKAGNTAYGGGFNLDIGGVQRLDAHGMDIGAYRYQPKRFGDKPRPAERFLNETVTLHVDVSWEGEGKGTADAPFKSLTRAMAEYSHLRNRYCYEHYMDNGKLGPFFVIKMADGVYNRSVEEFGANGMIDAAGGSLRIEGSYVGWEQGDGFDWSPTNRGRRTTILDPEGKSRVFIGKGFPEYRQIHFDNLEFRNGRAPIGGAIYFGGESKTLILTDCVFRNNEATAGAGGAVYNDSYGFPHRTYPFTRNAVIDCQFIKNRAEQGGGGMAANLASNVGPGFDYVIRNTTFRGNTAGKSGGGLWLKKPCREELMKAHVIDTRFVDNEAGESGGGMFTLGQADVARCLFADNRAPRGAAIGANGSVMDMWGNSRAAEWAEAPLALRETLIVGNQGETTIEYGIAKRGPHFKHMPEAPGLLLAHCTVADNAGGIHYFAGKNAKHSADLRIEDSVIANNGKVGIAFEAGNSKRAATIVRSNVSGHETNYQNAEPGEGSGSEDVTFVNNTAEQVLQRDYRLREPQGRGAAAQTVMAQAGYHDVPAPERLARRLQAVTAAKGSARAPALTEAVAQIQYPAMLPSHFDWPPILPETERLKHLRTLLDACDNAEEQAIVLATLANVRCKNAVEALALRSVEALRLVRPHLDRAETRAAAASLVVKILEHEGGVFETHRDEAVAACEAILKNLTVAEMIDFAERQAREAMTQRQEEDLRIREYAANYLPYEARLESFNAQWSKAETEAARRMLLTSTTVSRRSRIAELGRIYSVPALARAIELATGPLADTPDLKQAALDASVEIAMRLRPRDIGDDGATRAIALLKEAMAVIESDRTKAELQQRIAFFQSVPRLSIPRTDAVPQVDGRLDEAAWKNAARVDRLKVATENIPETPGGTQVHLAYDDKNLYVAFECAEPNRDGVLARAAHHDMPEVMRDDSVDVFIDAAPAGQYQRVERRFLAHTEFHARPAWTPEVYYGITANSKATVQDLASDWSGHINNTVFLGGKEEDYTWQSNAKVAAVQDDDGWTVEMAIPWASMDREAPQPGERIGLNLSRNRTLPDVAGAEHGVETPLRPWGTHERIRRFHDRRWLGWSQHWFHNTIPPLHELSQWSITGEDPMNWRHGLAAPRFGAAVFE